MNGTGSPAVLKFGGSLLAELEGYAEVARYVAARVTVDAKPVVVVVSAMSGTTGKLQEVLDEVAPHASAHVSTMLLTSGETVSVALLAGALEEIGMPARAMWSGEAGVFATGLPDRPTLITVNPVPLREALRRSPVVIIPGGSAYEGDGRTVMLGRNSSDLTAVAVAAALETEVCELFSNVPGICSADPYKVANTSTLPEINYADAKRMSRSGAKAVNEAAVVWAERTGTVLCCRPFPVDSGKSTTVGPNIAPVDAVILNSKEAVWSFTSAERRDMAEAALVADGVAFTRVEHLGVPYLMVSDTTLTCEGRPGAPQAHPDLCLLSTLHREGGVDEVLLPKEEAGARIQEIHDLLYPSTAPGQDGIPGLVGKHHSPHSGVLLTADSVAGDTLGVGGDPVP